MSELSVDWNNSPLGMLAEISIGGTPSRDIEHYWASANSDGFLWVAISDLQGRVITNTREQITEEGIRNSNVKLVSTGTVLMSFKLSLGRVAFAGRDLYTNEAIAAFKPRGQITEEFLFYVLPEAVRKTATDVAIKGATLNKESLSKLSIPYPDVPVQQKIAAILTSIDTAIEKTEALIEKYRQIKVGLMHDLFTRGVLPNAQLRPPREQAPELYQKTAIGWVPKDWVFTSCAKVCEKIIDCKNRTPPETPDGFPVIRTPNVRNGEFIDNDLLYTDEHSYAIWTMRGKPQVGDIVITREAPVGEVCMIPSRHPTACLGQRMMLYRPNHNVIDAKYFLYALQSRQIQNRLDLISGGSTVGHVRVGDIRDLWMFMPESRVEQSQVAGALEKSTEKLSAERAHLNKLKQQKLGLMQDLLTGKVPVKVEAKTSPETKVIT